MLNVYDFHKSIIETLSQYNDGLIPTIEKELSQTEELTKFLNIITKSEGKEFYYHKILRKLNEFLSSNDKFTESFRRKFRHFLIQTNDENWYFKFLINYIINSFTVNSLLVHHKVEILIRMNTLRVLF